MANIYSKPVNFPSDEDAARLKTLSRLEKLYTGQHFKVFGMKDYFKASDINKGKMYIALNLCALISEYYADMIIGDGVYFDVPNEGEDGKELQKSINEIVERNDLDRRLFEVAVTQSKSGFGVIRVAKDDITGEALIQEVPVDQYFPVWSGAIDPKMTECTLASYIDLADEKGKTKEYIYKQIYSYTVNGSVYLEHQLWSTKSIANADGTYGKHQDARKPISLFDSSLTDGVIDGITQIPVFKIDNIRGSGSIYGKSDYDDISDLIAEINNRITQISIQLVKNLNAKLAVPRGTITDDGTVQSTGTELFEVGEGEGAFVPKFILNENPLIKEGFNQIEDLTRQVSAITKIPMDVFGIDTKGGAERVEAMRMRLWNTLRKATRKRIYFDKTLKNIIRMCVKVETGMDVDSDIKVVWSDILPEDKLEKTEMLVSQVAGGLKSPKKAVKELQDLDDADLEEEMAMIEEAASNGVQAFAEKFVGAKDKGRSDELLANNSKNVPE